MSNICESFKENMNDAIKKLDSIPPVVIGMEMSRIAWDIIGNNIDKLKEFSDCITGIAVTIVEGDKELGINKARVVFDKGEDKVITIFNWNYDFKYNFTKELNRRR